LFLETSEARMLDPADRAQLNALIQKTHELERKVDFLLRHLGVQYRDERPPPDEIEQLVVQGDRIGAIKLHQARHRSGLADAKRAIEELAARLGVR
jgi:hypothetical protein